MIVYLLELIILGIDHCYLGWYTRNANHPLNCGGGKQTSTDHEKAVKISSDESIPAKELCRQHVKSYSELQVGVDGELLDEHGGNKLPDYEPGLLHINGAKKNATEKKHKALAGCPRLPR